MDSKLHIQKAGRRAELLTHRACAEQVTVVVVSVSQSVCLSVCDPPALQTVALTDLYRDMYQLEVNNGLNFVELTYWAINCDPICKLDRSR